MDVLLLLLGVILVLGSSEILIRYSSKLAAHFGVSDAVLGLTIISVGTSLPEIFSHLVGSVRILDDPSRMDVLSGLLIGGNIGSDIFQQLVLIGMVALFGYMVMQKENIHFEAGALLAATILVLALGLDGKFGRIDGVILVVVYIGYLWKLMHRGIDDHGIKGECNVKSSIALVIISLAVLLFAANTVLKSSESLLAGSAISASLFGVLILGIMSALPELVTSGMAIARGRGDVSVGVLFGSNVTNPLLALGLGAIISTYTVPSSVLLLDLPFKAVTAAGIYYILFKRGRIGLLGGIVLITLFLAYLFARHMYFPTDVVFG